MTPEAAIHQLMSGFGIPAYTESSVPDQEAPEWGGFPYLTYQPMTSSWGAEEVSIPVNVYDRTTSEKAINERVREIGRVVGLSGVTIPCDGGMLWVKRGSPWAQAMSVDGESKMIKRRYLNFDIEFLTID